MRVGGKCDCLYDNLGKRQLQVCPVHIDQFLAEAVTVARRRAYRRGAEEILGLLYSDLERRDLMDTAVEDCFAHIQGLIKRLTIPES